NTVRQASTSVPYTIFVHIDGSVDPSQGNAGSASVFRDQFGNPIRGFMYNHNTVEWDVSPGMKPSMTEFFIFNETLAYIYSNYSAASAVIYTDCQEIVRLNDHVRRCIAYETITGESWQKVEMIVEIIGKKPSLVQLWFKTWVRMKLKYKLVKICGSSENLLAHTLANNARFMRRTRVECSGLGLEQTFGKLLLDDKTRVVLEMGKSRAAPFSLGVDIDEGEPLHAYSDIVEDNCILSIGSKELLCLIFVERVIEAKVIDRFMKKLSYLSHFMVSHLTGTNASKDALSASVQKKTLDSFRRGEVNLLFTTDVAEEGIDIANCSYFIRFYMPKTVCSYVQA
ncbi:Endoribonuclease dicer-like protein, partial [Thalictrum thalictroides]